MQITIKGEMSIADIRRAIYEELGKLEDEFALGYSQGATLYVNPTNGEGDPVILRKRDGRVLGKLMSEGPYRSIADDFKI